MADSRSVMQEFRFLEQKRQAGTLTPAEAARHAELRDLVGFEQPAPARGGFDVSAAAAHLRDSLLPAGLRSRPLEAPTPPPAFQPAVPPPPSAPVEPEPAPEPAAEAFFDPASLGQEVRPQAWNPEAPGYDPDAPYDEAAWIAAGYDPNATYDWSALGGEAAPPAEAQAEPEAPPFGEYDAAGGPPPAVAPEELPPEEPPPAAAPSADGGGAWFDDTEVAAEAAPPGAAPAFGEYDAVPPPPPVVADESSFGGPEGDNLPGGVPFDPGQAPEKEEWLPDGALDAGFELASDGSFGEPAAAPTSPWSSSPPAPPNELWESPPALDLSTPFEPLLIPAARPPPPAAPEPFASLEPEEALEPIPEISPEPAAPALETLPAEPAWPPPAPEPEPTPEPTPEPAAEAEPISLGELDASMEIDIPPEISAAYDLPPAAARPPAFAPAPAAAAAPPAPQAEVEPEPVPAPAAVVAGAHRVVVHTLDGQVLRGTLTDADLEAPELALEPGGAAPAAAVATARVKAIFFMLAPGQQAPEPQGKRVRVTFRDGRQVAGFSPDYQEGGVGFFMIPADTRTNTGRIWVYQAAVKQVSVS